MGRFDLKTRTGQISAIIQSTDSDAQAFFNRVTVAGGSLTLTEQSAITQLVLDLKANSLWTPMKAIYPMVGASAAACSRNLKADEFNATFSSGWTFASTGVQGNGTNAEFVTNFALNNFASKNSVAFGLYSRTNIDSAGVGMTAKTDVEFYANYDSLGQTYSYLFDNNNNSVVRLSYLGLNSHSRVSSSLKYMQAKTTINSFTSNVNAVNLDASIVKFSKTAQGFDSNQYALYYISDGLNDTKLLNLNTVIETFQTTLNRNV